MRKVIVDYKKLNEDILDLLVEKFPDGYDDRDIISFRNLDKETIEAVEVRTEDTIYLVKISKRLADTMESYNDDDEDDTTSNNEATVDLEEMEEVEDDD